MPQRQVSTTHSTSTFTVSRLRQKPASSIVKPTCIPKTRNAAMRVHAVLIGLITSPALTGASAAYALVKNLPVPIITRSTTSPTPKALPPSNIFPYWRHSGSRNRIRNRESFSDSESLGRALRVADICYSPFGGKITKLASELIRVHPECETYNQP